MYKADSLISFWYGAKSASTLEFPFGTYWEYKLVHFDCAYIVVTKARWWSSLTRLSSPSVILLLSSGCVGLSQVQVVWDNWLKALSGGLGPRVGATQSAQSSLQSEIDGAILSDIGDALDWYGLI